MRKYMQYSLFSKTFGAIVVAMCALVSMVGCTEQNDELNVTYGYVQFKLYKNDTAPKESVSRAGSDELYGQLNYLSDACKVGVSLERPDGSVIEQTLVLHSYNAENASYGMRSDKLQLLEGEYTVTNYRLYGKKDEVIASIDASSSFTIIADGLVYHNLSADVVKRGKASFRLVKPKNFIVTRSGEEGGAYLFSDIKAISLVLKSDTHERVEINNVLVKLEEGFHDYAIDSTAVGPTGEKYNAQTESFIVDTVVWLKEGTYEVVGYTTYSDKKAKNVTF